MNKSIEYFSFKSKPISSNRIKVLSATAFQTKLYFGHIYVTFKGIKNLMRFQKHRNAVMHFMHLSSL